MVDFDPFELEKSLGQDWALLREQDAGRNGVYRFLYGESEPIIIAFIPVSTPRIALYANIGLAGSEACLRWALQKMDFWTGLEYPTIGLRHDTGELTVTEVLTLTQEQVSELPTVLNGFVGALHELRREFKALDDVHAEVSDGVRV